MAIWFWIVQPTKYAFLSLRIEKVKKQIVINNEHKSFSLHRVGGYGILISRRDGEWMK